MEFENYWNVYQRKKEIEWKQQRQQFCQWRYNYSFSTIDRKKWFINVKFEAL